MTTEFTANPTAFGGNRSSITVIIEDHPGQDPGIGSADFSGGVARNKTPARTPWILCRLIDVRIVR